MVHEQGVQDMETVLWIDCCIRREGSRTKQLAQYALEEIKKSGAYEVQELCLMDENLSYFTDGFFEQRERLLERGQLSHPRFRYAREFATADKIVIAAPFWDLSFPALLKVYIENLCVEGITFGCNENGCFGICKADHLLYLTTRGGFYQDNPMEMGARYIEVMSQFFGIEQFSCVAADGLDAGVRPVEEILEEAKKKIDAVLVGF